MDSSGLSLHSLGRPKPAPSKRIRPAIVIPADDGIQRRVTWLTTRVALDPSIRWDDEQRGDFAAHNSSTSATGAA